MLQQILMITTLQLAPTLVVVMQMILKTLVMSKKKPR